MPTVYCAHCGTQNEESAGTCRSCGAALAPDAASPPAAAPGRLPTAANQHWAVPDFVSTMLPGAAPHRRRTFWLALLIGAAIFGAWALLAGAFSDPSVDIRVLVFGAFFVPVLFVFFMASEGLTEEPPALVLIEVFVGVALVGNLVAWLLNSFVFPFPWAVGFVEEGTKFLAVVWLLRRRKFASIMDGILFGAAAGMGFAASENLSYFFNVYTTSGLAAVVNALQANQISNFDQVMYVFNHVGMHGLFGNFMLRSFLGPWMHGSWTAIIAGTAWRESAGGKMRLDLRFFATYIFVALTHSAWDNTSGTLQWILLVVIIAVDIYLLRSLILAAHRQERGEPIEAPAHAAAPGAAVLQRARVVAPARRQARFCAQCGEGLKPGAKFCAHCGSPAGPAVVAAQPVGAPGIPTPTA